MSFQEMYWSRGPWGQMAVLQLTYELRPKWKNNNNKNNKTQNAVSRSDPLQGSDKDQPWVLDNLIIFIVLQPI